MKIGPLPPKFAGKVQSVDLDPPNGYRIEGEGQGGVAGVAKGGASVRLAQDGRDTILSYDVKANVGGKIAQVGARLIDATAKQMADAFFDRFAAQVATAEPDADAAPAPIPAAPTISVLDLIPREPGGLPIVAWIGIVLFVPVALLLLKGFDDPSGNRRRHHGPAGGRRRRRRHRAGHHRAPRHGDGAAAVSNT